jgi:hypothetical protein
MSQAAVAIESSRTQPAGRIWVACVSLALSLLVVSALIAMVRGVPMPFISHRAPPLTDELAATLKTSGPAAAEAEYRTLKAQQFAGYSESENETNNLGYQFLGKGDAADAVVLFKLNAETHPDSANVFDSLGEGEAAAGDKQAAITSYRHALELNVHEKSSEIALAKLTGVPRKPFSIFTLMHMTAGMLGILLGIASMVVRKGGRWHRLVGDGFFISMIVMAVVGGSLAVRNGESANVFGSTFTLYLLLTAWSAGRRRERMVNSLNYVLLVAGALLALFGLSQAFEALADHGFVAPFIGFGILMLLGTAMDLRVIMSGGITGPARIARHLWRMSAAFFVAVTSFFLGQPQLMPAFLERTNLVALPSVLVVLAMLYYLFRVLYWDRRRGRRSSFRIEAIEGRGGVALGG